MLRFIRVVFFLFFSSNVGAHEYFFAFAEVNYNRTNHTFEITIEASAHDVEDVFNESGIAIQELEDHYTDSLMLRKIQEHISEGFEIKTATITARLHLDGFEVLPNGMVYFYVSSDEISIGESVDIQFGWLMDVLPKQQNKISLEVDHQKYTDLFTYTKRTSTIKFDKK